MPSLNKVMIIGNVGSDPELRYTPNGNPVSTFRVATNRYYKTQSGEKKQETDWFSVVTWNALAEQCNKYLNKGKLCFIEGRLHNRSFEKDGEKQYRTEIVAARVTFLERREAGENGGGEAEEAATETAENIF